MPHTTISTCSKLAVEVLPDQAVNTPMLSDIAALFDTMGSKTEQVLGLQLLKHLQPAIFCRLPPTLVQTISNWTEVPLTQPMELALLARINSLLRTNLQPSIMGKLCQVVRVTPGVLVMAFLYMQRLETGRCLQPLIDRWQGERVLVAALVLASKYHNDEVLSNAMVCENITNLTVQELFALEQACLQGLDFQLHVTPTELFGFISKL